MFTCVGGIFPTGNVGGLNKRRKLVISCQQLISGRNLLFPAVITESRHIPAPGFCLHHTNHKADALMKRCLCPRGISCVSDRHQKHLWPQAESTHTVITPSVVPNALIGTSAHFYPALQKTRRAKHSDISMNVKVPTSVSSCLLL